MFLVFDYYTHDFIREFSTYSDVVAFLHPYRFRFSPKRFRVVKEV